MQKTVKSATPKKVERSSPTKLRLFSAGNYKHEPTTPNAHRKCRSLTPLTAKRREELQQEINREMELSPPKKEKDWKEQLAEYTHKLRKYQSLQKNESPKSETDSNGFISTSPLTKTSTWPKMRVIEPEICMSESTKLESTRKKRNKEMLKIWEEQVKEKMQREKEEREEMNRERERLDAEMQIYKLDQTNQFKKKRDYAKLLDTQNQLMHLKSEQRQIDREVLPMGYILEDRPSTSPERPKEYAKKLQKQVIVTN